MKSKVLYLCFNGQEGPLHLKPGTMKISRTKFIVLFLTAAFAFQLISNSLLESDFGLFPSTGELSPGEGSPTPWKSTLSAVLYPVKVILLGPLAPLLKEPDAPPPILLIAFALYLTGLAWFLYFPLRKIFSR